MSAAGATAASGSATAAERMVCLMAAQVRNGDLLAQGIATPLVASAYLLARRRQAPRLACASAVGTALSACDLALGIESAEPRALKGSLRHLGFVEAACEFLPFYNPKEFFRPGQVDRWGNFNNVAIGDYAAPVLRLPGAGGISDVTNYSRHIYLYVPRMMREIFVEKVDFVSGIGFRPGESAEERRARGVRSPGPLWLVTDLCVMDFGGGGGAGGGVGGELRVVSLHRGATREQVLERMSFEPRFADPLPETPEPTAEELRVLREEVDPGGLRELELAGGKERVALLRRVIAAERAGVQGPRSNESKVQGPTSPRSHV
ncbi:MAG: hypothetical protein HZA54_02455 [Planctomycetes bacterium]|nr:hypothetical protein [Planctomycetota bacterium]